MSITPAPAGTVGCREPSTIFPRSPLPIAPPPPRCAPSTPLRAVSAALSVGASAPAASSAITASTIPRRIVSRLHPHLPRRHRAHAVHRRPASARVRCP